MHRLDRQVVGVHELVSFAAGVTVFGLAVLGTIQNGLGLTEGLAFLVGALALGDGVTGVRARRARLHQGKVATPPPRSRGARQATLILLVAVVAIAFAAQQYFA